MAALNSHLRVLLNLPVNRNIRTNPPVVAPSDPVNTVLSQMIKENIGAVIVVEDNLPIGIITEKDMINRVLYAERDLNTTKAREVMSSPIIAIDGKSSVMNGLELLRENDIKRVREFRDPNSISDSVISLLNDRTSLEEYPRRAYQYSRDMIWPNVAMKYFNVLYEALGF